MMYALLLSQDSDETALLTVVLQRAGYAVRTARTIDQLNLVWSEAPLELLLIAAQENPPAAEIRQIRSQAEIPIVLVLSSISEDLQIQLLQAGADLTVCRPYSARLLIAQLRALGRRSSGMRFFKLPVQVQGSFLLDASTRTVQVEGGEPKRLTQLEFRLMYALMAHAGQVVPSETLVEHVWGYSGEGDRNLVRGLVKRLRSKVEPDPANPRFILTDPGVGYSFNTRA